MVRALHIHSQILLRLQHLTIAHCLPNYVLSLVRKISRPVKETANVCFLSLLFLHVLDKSLVDLGKSLLFGGHSFLVVIDLLNLPPSWVF